MRPALVVLLLGLACAPASRAIELRLKPSALVPAHSFNVADVAEISDAPADVAAKLASVEVGHSPRLGYRERVERREIEQRIRVRAGVRELSWSGAEAVFVETAATVVAAQEIADAAALHLQRTLSADHQRIAMGVVEDVGDVRVPRGVVRLVPRSLTYSEALRRQAVVWIDVHVDGAFYRSVPVSFRVEVWRDAWVTSDRVNPGSHLDCASLERRTVDVAALGAPVFDAPCAQGEWVARQRIEAGAPIRASSIAPPSWVVRGQALTVRSAVGSVSVERTAVALRDRAPGQLVSLRTEGATDAVSARLVVPATTTTEEN